MNREKKQLMVMGALILMIVCVGAFQMLGGSPEPAPAPKKAAKKELTSKVEEDKPKIANPDEAHPLAKRDPFAPSTFAILANTDPNAPVPPKPDKNDRKIKTGSHQPIPLPNTGSTSTIPDFNNDIVPPLKVDPPKFGYSLIGFVQGRFPAAVFADASGNQKLVEAGQAIDASAILVAVYGNKVKVKFHDQTLVLTVGGTPHGK